MKLNKELMAYTCFMIATGFIPISRLIWSGQFSSLAFKFQPFLYLSSIILIILHQNMSLSKILQRQQQFLVCYTFSIINIYFLWKVFYYEDQSQYEFGSFISYINNILSIMIYSVITRPNLNKKQYWMIQICTIIRVITYGLKTANIIDRNGENPQAKDYYLIFFATQIGICAFFIDTTHKLKKQTEKISILTNQTDS